MNTMGPLKQEGSKAKDKGGKEKAKGKEKDEASAKDEGTTPMDEGKDETKVYVHPSRSETSHTFNHNFRASCREGRGTFLCI